MLLGGREGARIGAILLRPFPKGGPIGTNTKASGCGLETLVTDGRPGGTVLVVMKGSGPAPTGLYTWDVKLHVPIAK